MPTRFAVLGSGAWGTTISLLLAQANHSVALWSARAESAQHLQQFRENPLLPGVPIPPQILLTGDVEKATNQTELLIVAVPTKYLRTTIQRITKSLPASCPMLSLVKGLERETFLRPSEILAQVTGPRSMAVLSGPNHAEEISRGLPAGAVVASEDLSLARWIQQCFSTDRFRVYTNLDLIGVELAGGLKNIIAIAAGVGDGLQLGDNAKAALLTRGLVEMTRFAVIHGAEPQTFTGLAGMGDLIATCISPHGRNRSVGLRLGRGEKIDDILASMKMVAEGVNTTESVFRRAQQMGVAMPITEAVHRILFEGKDPREAVTDLMVRAPKSEK